MASGSCMPTRIGVLTSISGVSFRTAWRNRIMASTTVGDVAVLGLGELRANKLASGRPKDLADIALLDGWHSRGSALAPNRGGVRGRLLLELEAAVGTGALDQRGCGAAGGAGRVLGFLFDGDGDGREAFAREIGAPGVAEQVSQAG
jgi:hypothetical protein